MSRIRKDARGFRVFAEFQDSKGNTVRVKESSAADLEAVWIFSAKPDGGDYPPHLSRADARKVIRGLQRSLDRKH